MTETNTGGRPPARAKHHHGAKRVALTGLAILGGLVALLCILVGGTFLVLQTDWGGERLRRRVVSGANQQIQGQLSIGRLSFGGNKVAVWDVALNDPAGGPVARVGRVEVEFRILDLLRKQLHIPSLIIERPQVTVASAPDGTSNLTRATAPRHKVQEKPKQAAPFTREEGWVVQLDRFQLKDGAVGLASERVGGATQQTVRLEDLQAFLNARYATGNGNLTSSFRVTGRSALTPEGPFRFEWQANKTLEATHFTMDSDLLGGTIKARADIPNRPPAAPAAGRQSGPPAKPEADLQRMDGEVKVAIPRQGMRGFDWGPFNVTGAARPGTIPSLDILLAIPGVQLSGKSDSKTAFDFQGRLALLDLGLTAKAANALSGSSEPAPEAAGRGHIDFAFGGPMEGAPASWSTHWAGEVERLRSGESAITGLTVGGRVAHLSTEPGEVDFKLAVDSIASGTTRLGKVAFAAKLRQQDVWVDAHVVTPQALNLAVAGRIDADRRGFSLNGFALDYPDGKWTLDKPARIRTGDQSVSLTPLRLLSNGQSLSVEGEKNGEEISARLVVDKLRLDQLPHMVADPKLRLGGTLDVDVKATGQVEAPKVAAHVELKQARFQAFSRLYAKVDATLEDQKVDGSLSAEAPFTAIEARFKMPTDVLAPGAPLDLRVDVTKLDLGEALRTAAVAAPADGNVTMTLQVAGSASDPKVEMTVNGKGLSVTKAATVEKARDVIDLGHVRMKITYARKTARADIDFGSAHGGTLKIDAAAKVDLSYPRVTRPIVVAKIPVEGKVVAHDLDVAWISSFSDRVQTLGGQVNADAKLAGTVGDPKFLGDVRWKNGNVVTTVPKNKPVAPAPKR